MIPDKAVEAAADALHRDNCPCDPAPGESCNCGNWEREAEVALTAALPIIEQAVLKDERERCEYEIRDYWEACGELIDTHNGARLAFDAVAARIAEGSGE